MNMAERERARRIDPRGIVTGCRRSRADDDGSEMDRLAKMPSDGPSFCCERLV
jgi:hypothetical protein